MNSVRSTLAMQVLLALWWLNAPALAVEPDPRVLFLAHFNSRLEPDVGQLTDPVAATLAERTAAGEGFPFSDSDPVAAGLDLRRRSSRIVFPVDAASFRGAAGTVEFWYQPQSPQSTAFAILFRVMFQETHSREHTLDQGDQFILFLNKDRKPGSKPSLVFSSRSTRRGIAYRTRPITPPLRWGADWHFVAITWTGAEGAVYVDGQLAKAGTYVRPVSAPVRFVLGSDFMGHDAEGVIDELRILDQPLSAATIAADYERGALQHLEFPAPATAQQPQPPKPLVEPYQPCEAGTGPGVQLPLEDVHFQAVALAAGPPEIDGRLDDQAWEAAPVTTGFVARTRTQELADVQTELRFLYDHTHLYVGARMAEPDMGLLRMDTVLQRDMPVWQDDCLELFIDTSGSADTFYHFIVNSAGTLADFRGSHLNWSAMGASSAGAKAGDHWTFELAIPFADFGVTASFGDIWGFRVCRARRALAEGGTQYSCLPYIAGPFKNYTNLGQLHFGAAGLDTLPVQVQSEPAPVPFLGMNLRCLNIENRSEQPVTVALNARAVAQNNVLLSASTETIAVAAGASARVTLKLSVTSDALEAVSVTASDADTGAPLFGERRRTAVSSRPGLDWLREQLPGLRATCASLPPQSALTKTVKESVKRMTAHLTRLEARLKDAVANGALLPEPVWREFERELAGFRVWCESYAAVAWPDRIWDNGLPTSFPTDEPALAELSVSMAVNEREAVGLSLTGVTLAAPVPMQVVAADLIEENQERLPGTKERFGRNQVHVAWAAPLRDEGRRFSADPLVRSSGNIFTLIPGRTLKLWVVLDSAGAAPGTYVGDLVVRPLDTLALPPERWLRIPLRVTVWPFELPETRDNPLEAFLTTGLGAHFNLHIDPVAMTRDLYEHRVNWVQCDWSEVGRRSSRTEPDHVITADDLSNCDMLFRQAKAHGMKVMFMWGACNPKSVKSVVEYMQSLGFGPNEFASQSPHDEFAATMVPDILEYHRQVRELGTPMRYMTTYARRPPDGADLEQITPMLEVIDIWVNHAAKWWPPGPGAQELLDLQRQHGVTIAGYQCSGPMRFLPHAAYYRRFPWQAWRMDVRMVVFWAYVACLTGDNDAWDVHHDRGRMGPNGMVYLGTGGDITPSKRYEAFREGMEDYCYLWILRNRIQAAKAAGTATASAEAFLAGVVDKGVAAETMQDMHALRNGIAEQILSLPPTAPADR